VKSLKAIIGTQVEIFEWFRPTKSWHKRNTGPTQGKGKRCDANDEHNQELGLELMKLALEAAGFVVTKVLTDQDLDPAKGAFGKTDWGIEFMNADGELCFIVMEFKGRGNVHPKYFEEGMYLSVSKNHALERQQAMQRAKGIYGNRVYKFFIWTIGQVTAKKDTGDTVANHAIIRWIPETQAELIRKYPPRPLGARGDYKHARNIELMHVIPILANDPAIILNRDGWIAPPNFLNCSDF
jgi:hypothetical protein